MKSTILAIFFLASGMLSGMTVEQYSVFELRMEGPATDNPFKDVQFTAEFS